MPLLNLRVEQLDPNSASARSRMVKFPFKLYKGDPYWVPQLTGDRKKYLDPKHNPSFEYLKVAYFVAEATVIPESSPKGTLSGGMEQDVGIGMAQQPLIVRDFHPAQHQPSARREAMAVIAEPDPHGLLPEMILSARSRSSGVVILMLSASPEIIRTGIPVRSTREASSVP